MRKKKSLIKKFDKYQSWKIKDKTQINSFQKQLVSIRNKCAYGGTHGQKHKYGTDFQS